MGDINEYAEYHESYQELVEGNLEKERPLSFEDFCEVYDDNIIERCYKEYPEVFKTEEDGIIEKMSEEQLKEHERIQMKMYEEYEEEFE